MSRDDPLENFRERRFSGRQGPASDDTRSFDIDRMLDEIDRVVRSRRESESVRVDLNEGKTIAARENLRRILLELDRLERAVIPSHATILFAEFLARTRTSTLDALRALDDAQDMVQAGAEVEYELDWNRLHEFMLSPGIDRLESRS
ncbi:MAG: hypothetical protein KDB53_12760 [Planctomycetes bacterium]|nr:hypothetical protein [Planctomycetota bacterium]